MGECPQDADDEAALEASPPTQAAPAFHIVKGK
jgi:hypothetical protein